MVELKRVDPVVLAGLRAKLGDPNTALSAKYRILFSLRNIEGSEAHESILLGLSDSSALFRHDVAYCLGQRQDPAAIQALTRILNDTTEHPMVRHEAGEALGAIGTEECLKPLRTHVEDDCSEVAETCQLALQRIEWYCAAGAIAPPDAQSPYLSVDPTPPAPASVPTSDLRECLLNESSRIFDRYRAMFALRNRGGEEAIEALTTSFKVCKSALLKHEVAYVLGQMQDAGAVQKLQLVLKDAAENSMVRHEAAEALGSIASPACLDLLHEYSKDADSIVADSCIVALDMLEHEQSGAFQYAAAAGVDG